MGLENSPIIVSVKPMKYFYKYIAAKHITRLIFIKSLVDPVNLKVSEREVIFNSENKA